MRIECFRSIPILVVILGGNVIVAADDFFGYMSSDFSEIFSSGSIWPAAAGSGLTVISLCLESDSGYKGFLGESSLLRTSESVANTAFGIALLGASSSVWLCGELAGHSATAESGQMLTEGLLITYGITGGLKLLTARRRPDASNTRSFPSAHAAGTSCAAVILWDRCGPGAGIPVSLLAVFTGISRVDLGVHYPSDVIAGTAIGILTGLAISRAHGLESDTGQDGFRIGWDSCLGLRIGF